jgi:hypothetical protein
LKRSGFFSAPAPLFARKFLRARLSQDQVQVIVVT